MYQELIEKNISHIRNTKKYRNYDLQISQLTDGLNKNSIVTITGLRHTGRTALAQSLLKKNQILENSFYYNQELDTLGIIKNKNDFITLFDVYVRIYGIPKVIVLQNMNNIEGIKKLISQFYASKKYKIIIIGNNIQIEGVSNIELYPLPMSDNIEKNMRGGLPNVRVIPENGYKDSLLKQLRNDIMLVDIIQSYNIKNISLYYSVLGYLSENIHFQSVREIHRNLEHLNIQISHLTLIDYLASAVNTKLISRCFRYDMKTQKEISSKVLYYFGDVGIRNSFGLKSKLHSKNLLYIDFLSKGYNVHGGINGKFIFDFYARNGNASFCIHFETSTDKSEIRRTARKLAKIDSSADKYVVVESKENIGGMRKFEEQGVEILELHDLVQRIK